MASLRNSSRTEQILGDILPNKRRTQESDKFAAGRLLVLQDLLKGDLDYDTTISYNNQALHTQELDIKFVNVLKDLFRHVARWKENPDTLNNIPRVDAQLLIWFIFSYSNAKRVWNKFVESTIEQVKYAEDIIENRSSMSHMQNMTLEQRLRFVRTMLEDNLALDAKAGSGSPTISNFKGCRKVSGATCPECMLAKVDEAYLKLKDHNNKDKDFQRWYDKFGPKPQESQDRVPKLEAELISPHQQQEIRRDEPGKLGRAMNSQRKKPHRYHLSIFLQERSATAQLTRQRKETMWNRPRTWRIARKGSILDSNLSMPDFR